MYLRVRLCVTCMCVFKRGKAFGANVDDNYDPFGHQTIAGRQHKHAHPHSMVLVPGIGGGGMERRVILEEGAWGARICRIEEGREGKGVKLEEGGRAGSDESARWIEDATGKNVGMLRISYRPHNIPRGPLPPCTRLHAGFKCGHNIDIEYELISVYIYTYIYICS